MEGKNNPISKDLFTNKVKGSETQIKGEINK